MVLHENLFTLSLQVERFIEVSLTKNVVIALVWCPPGEFFMGSLQDDEFTNPYEMPQHRVKLTRGFWISRTPITQTQWREVMSYEPRLFESGRDSELLPVDATWKDAKAFCSMLTLILREQKLLTGDQRIDLPTEAEWEYACRAGTQTSWYFGNISTELERHGWYLENSNEQKHPVGRKTANPWGLHDVYGNVAEWCLDDFHLYKPTAEGRVDPCFIDDAPLIKIARGGAFDALAEECRSASRRSIDMNNDYKEPVGFRIACVNP